MKGRISNILLIVFLWTPVVLWSQQSTKTTAAIDKDTILIGDHVNLRLEINTNEHTKISWPNFSEAFKSGVELLNLRPIDTVKNEDTVSYIQQLTLTSFDTGFYEIPGFDFSCVDQRDTSFFKSMSNPLFLRVNTIAVDTTQVFKPIKGPIGQGYTFSEAIPMAGGFLLLVLAGIAVYYIFFRKKDEPLFTARSKPKLAPHVIALNELEKLKNKKLWQEGRFKEYYTDLTDIFRIYLEGRFGVDAMEMTSDEIRGAIKPFAEIDDKIKSDISETLATSDLVKFAKMKPLPEENENNFRIMEGFVLSTKEKHEEKKEAPDTKEEVKQIPDTIKTEETQIVENKD